MLAAGIGLAGLSTGTAAAAPGCADFHWMGAAGSGQRDGAGLSANGGMGSVVYQSYQQLKSQLQADGLTMDAEAVQYPAAPVPLEGGLGGWLTFLGSVGDGTDATAEQYKAFTARCPDTKVILAGYSQGAMVVHRNLYDLADDPHLAAALLIADGDRLPVDSTIKLGSTAVTQSRGEGVAQVLGLDQHLAPSAGHRDPHDKRLRYRRSGVRLRPRLGQGDGFGNRDPHRLCPHIGWRARVGLPALQPGLGSRSGAVRRRDSPRHRLTGVAPG